MNRSERGEEGGEGGKGRGERERWEVVESSGFLVYLTVSLCLLGEEKRSNRKERETKKRLDWYVAICVVLSQVDTSVVCLLFVCCCLLFLVCCECSSRVCRGRRRRLTLNWIERDKKQIDNVYK